MTETTTIPASLQAVSAFTQQFEASLAAAPVELRAGLTLAMQELCVNIVEHAYAGQPGQITIAITRRADGLVIIIDDDGPHRFSLPQHISAPDPLDLPESGLGLYVIYQVFDHVDYQPHRLGSRWTLTKRL